MSDLDLLASFLNASVRMAVPLALVALGEAVSERSGVLNIGLEGCVISGAFGGAVVALASGSAPLGIVGGAAAGLLAGLVFAAFAVGLNMNQIIVGAAVTMGGLGFTAVLYQARFGVTGTALSLPTLGPIALPGLSSVPVVGEALFRQPGTAYLTFLLAPALWWMVNRTEWGLELRAAGEDPAAAEAAGVPVRWLRFWSCLLSGALSGVAGAHLSLAYTGTFTEGMSSGRGFIAIAVVVLGGWSPLGILLAALFFGAATALQFTIQAGGLDVAYPMVLALPYVLTLVALAGWVGRVRAPAALARPWPPHDE